jgi:hypothetical protein
MDRCGRRRGKRFGWRALTSQPYRDYLYRNRRLRILEKSSEVFADYPASDRVRFHSDSPRLRIWREAIQHFVSIDTQYLELAYEDLFSATSELTKFKTQSAKPKFWQSPVTAAFRAPYAPGSLKGTFPSIRSFLQSQLPIFIPTFNNITYLRMMVDQLKRLGLHNIIIIDNASDYPPLL